jgi:DNA-binding MurR/RpiR family transcriptional regulator
MANGHNIRNYQGISSTDAETPLEALPRPCLLAIQSAYPALSPKERAVAEFILGEPAVIHQSITEVVKRSGVGYGSIMRFCRRLGYAGFQDFKVHLAQDLARKAAPVDGNDDLLAVLAGKAVQDIWNTVHALSRVELLGAAGVLAAARSVLVAGVAASAVTALELEYRLIRLGINATTMADGHMQRVRAALLGPRDAVVLVSFSGATRDLLATARVAKTTGARVICLTNYRLSPLCDLAEYRLLTAIDSDPLGSEIVSRSTSAFLVDALCRYIADQRQDTQQILLQTSEAVSDAQL